MIFKDYLEKISGRVNLTKNEAEDIFTAMVSGRLEPVEIAALLVSLKTKGEVIDEIAGAAQALRDNALQFDRPDYLFADSCGTGGDGSHTINVSTAAGLVCAAAGLPVAKHGNRSITSKCGSADVLENLGVKLDASSEISRKALDEAGICFFFAPMYHSGLRHAGPVRKQLGMRTMMNILGPLVNPAAPDAQILGVFSEELTTTSAEVLRSLGTKSALVVNGQGLDEIAIHGTTKGALLKDGTITRMEFSPKDAGLKEFSLESIKGGSPQENSRTLRAVLEGRGPEAHNSAVAINAGALLWVAGKADSLKDGTSLAMDTILSGKSINTLNRLAEITNGA
ncbi:MAG: anthranilate phosphoribosyltransferase [Deltaproteobacteria bacterium]|nr:anthranilate phosphoribosyltransferase [Deltaproteobacteria bacterium]